MSHSLKPSLTEYADTLRVFKKINQLSSFAEGLSQNSRIKINNLTNAIEQAEGNAMSNRASKMNEGGTNAWQAANAEPFVIIAKQAKALLGDEGFMQDLASSQIPVADPENSGEVIRSLEYKGLTSSTALLNKATDIATMLDREETATGHRYGDRDLGRYALSPGKSPLAPV